MEFLLREIFLNLPYLKKTRNYGVNRIYQRQKTEGKALESELNEAHIKRALILYLSFFL